MKKYNYLLLLSAVTAATAFTSCDVDRLDIPEKGAASVSDFYLTDDDAQSALVTVYSDTYDNLAFMGDVTGWNYSPYLALTNWMADDIVLAGSGEGDCEPERQYHDFRYNSDLNIVEAGYKMFFRSIHKCNLLLSNIQPDSDKKKSCIAQAKVMRAFDYLMLAIYWGKPPIVEEVVDGNAQPESASSQDEVLSFVVKELDEAIALGLPKRNGPTDKNGAYIITDGFAKALKGKALMWKGDYAGAKTALKAVIDSKNYALVPSEEMKAIGHKNGKGSSEIVFEFNIQTGSNVKNFGNRQIGNFPYTFNWRWEFFQNGGPNDGRLNCGGWGWINPSKEWAEDLIANDGIESARRKAWIITYDELLYDIRWPSDKFASDPETFKIEPNKETGKNDTIWIPGKTAFKATDKDRGVGGSSGGAYYGNAGYFCWKTVMHEEGDNAKLNWCGTWDANFTIMRYAEVLLLYAEACARTNDNDGLQYLNAIQERAKSNHISSSLTLQEVKNEKRFEMWQDGCRAADLLRWKDYETLKTADHTIYMLRDALLDGSASEHKAVIVVDGASTFKGKGAGFKAGKYEFLPFPRKEVDLNPGLVQNPGWE